MRMVQEEPSASSVAYTPLEDQRGTVAQTLALVVFSLRGL
jgi:hypothetical protein